jgi:Cd2+/Zn2+-exporting ATPase
METQTLDIPIIWPNYFEDCEQCIQRLRTSLEALKGIGAVTIDLEHRAVQVNYDKSILTFDAIRDYASAVGVTFDQKYAHKKITLAGLDCPDCAAKLETAVTRMRGVVWTSMSFASSELIVEFEPQMTSLDAIVRRIREFGYDVEEAEPTPQKQRERRLRRGTRFALTVTSGALLLAGVVSQRLLGASSIPTVLLLASAITGGLFAARGAVYSVRALALDTNVLMTAAALGALLLGDYAEAAAVMFLFSLGSTLEAYAVERTRKSISSLIEEAPSEALVSRDGHWLKVSVEQVEVGETVMVKPGEKLPVDGTVTSGESAVNEAPITGESVPKSKSAGDSVYAGSTNGPGALEVRVTSRSDDNTIARIVHLVEEAQAQKAPSQRFSEAFGRVYTPVVIGLAVLTAVFAPVVTGQPFAAWLTRSLTLLVVACPCALVISTPVAVVAAIGSAARSGVLIKGGAHLEMLGNVNVVAFDKTGTLTAGRPFVQEVLAFDNRSTHEVLSLAADVEYRSEHPLANAIVDKAGELGLDRRHSTFFEAIPGKGARAVIGGGLYYVGNRMMMDDVGISIPDNPVLDSLAAQGSSLVWVADETSCWGVIALADGLRESAAETVSRLRDVGIRSSVLLTGDNASVGESVARQVGLDQAYCSLLPDAKLQKIKKLRGEGYRVAMIGDGINDAPALAAADVGIAMGGAGNQTAIEAADVALMADDLIMLPYAVQLGRRSSRIMRQNVWFALGVVVLLVTGALTSVVGLAAGVIGHETSALLVIANSLRLFKRPTSATL